MSLYGSHRPFFAAVMITVDDYERELGLQFFAAGDRRGTLQLLAEVTPEGSVAGGFEGLDVCAAVAGAGCFFHGQEGTPCWS